MRIAAYPVLVIQIALYSVLIIWTAPYLVFVIWLVLYTAGYLFGIGNADCFFVFIVHFSVAFTVFDTISIVCSPIGSVAI